MSAARSRRARETLYTIGYQQRTVPQLIGLLRTAGITVLVDVRDNPNSRKPGFSKRALERSLSHAGIAYVHAGFAGTPKWLRENADSHAQILEWYAWYLRELDEIVPAFDALVSERLAAGDKACVFCFELDPAECHRAILARLWASRRPGRAIVHLGDAPLARLE